MSDLVVSGKVNSMLKKKQEVWENVFPLLCLSVALTMKEGNKKLPL
jgi:hypothetical protein